MEKDKDDLISEPHVMLKYEDTHVTRTTARNR